MVYNEALKTCLHEFGHVLGLDHMEYNGSDNVMRSGMLSYKGKLGHGDLAVYRYLWGY